MLNKKTIENVLYAALSTGGDFAEIFVEDKYTTNMKMIGGILEDSISGRDYGVGIRIFNGFNSIYAYTNDSTEENLIKVAKEAALAINLDKKNIVLNLMKNDVKNNNKIITLPRSVEKAKKIEIMKNGYLSAKNYDEVISQVTVSYLDEEQNVLIANSEGLMAEDKRVRTRMAIQSVATKSGEMQIGFSAPGASMGFEFYENIDIEEHGREASRIAKTMIDAEFCPSGKMPVVIHNGFGGVLFHEACGHGLEATSVAKNTSVFSNKLNEKVASSVVTAIDDGTIPNEWGTTNIDDEGTPTRKNLLIENGILKGYLVDKLNGRRMDYEPTGSSRRQSYKLPPTSRMNNTYIANGKSTFEEIISNTESGLFAKKLGGGSVNPATGDFNFAVMEGYLIENGKITKPVRGATLIGNGTEVLDKIDMVGNNLKLAQGMCGSVSGLVPVNVGQPTIRVKNLTVGGRKGDE
ncbi:TldD/PmbA family protein [Anaerosalibacter bizertensis]|uniref:TldD/PmbA family protein n=1 Tax=Anaerosalibacter bizertensis TaxID=932217 RepID=A0A844FG32_9FIRM|nr:TldD/PmbA family protein [Anaerosalibacter bizertensis]MBU5292664.1 TldD/PmbA family protein [Anaerosalibacter bizertensis]MCB5559091.1 TldD/PmbA family protein [Anaerosalibacter bizertensis]MSS43003.1 TldD/PmbA family protein [Anaerosalibacter bizertensis]